MRQAGGGPASLVLVRENSIKWWTSVQGLNHYEASGPDNTTYYWVVCWSLLGASQHASGKTHFFLIDKINILLNLDRNSTSNNENWRILFQIRQLSEKVCDQPECWTDKEKIVEFTIPTWQVRPSNFCSFHQQPDHPVDSFTSMFVNCTTCLDAECLGETGLPGGHLRQPGHRAQQVRHQGAGLDAPQGEGRVGGELQVKLAAIVFLLLDSTEWTEYILPILLFQLATTVVCSWALDFVRAFHQWM